MSFTDAGFPITGCQSEALDASGTATCAQTYTSTSSHPIVAIYSGDASFAGTSSAALTQKVTIPAAPAATAAITNVANGATTVGFNASALARRHHRNAAGASSVTGFNVYEGTAPGKESTKPVNPSRLLATSTGYRVSGLANGTKYYFVVRAINPAGLGARSKEVSAIPATAPAAPGNLAAQRGTRSARLTWTAPASNGGGAITGYNVYAGTAPGGESATPVNATPLGRKVTAYTVNGLINGTTYYFTVRAANAVADGAVSKEASATPASAPYQPSKLLAYPGKGSAALTWAAPQQDGGSLITGYNVYKGTAPGGESGTPVNATPLSRTATGYTVTGLANGTKYYFTVKAINEAGVGIPSREASATPTTAATAPTAPRTLAASPAPASAALTWVKPASTGGSAITGYNVYEGTLPGGESGSPVNAKPLAATATTYTVTGLTNAAGYYFTVKAINAVGAGAPSNEASATPEASTTFPGRTGQPEGHGRHPSGRADLDSAGVERGQPRHRLQRLQGHGAGRRVHHPGKRHATCPDRQELHGHRAHPRHQVLLHRESDQHGRTERPLRRSLGHPLNTDDHRRPGSQTPCSRQPTSRAITADNKAFPVATCQNGLFCAAQLTGAKAGPAEQIGGYRASSTLDVRDRV